MYNTSGRSFGSRTGVMSSSRAGNSFGGRSGGGSRFAGRGSGGSSSRPSSYSSSRFGSRSSSDRVGDSSYPSSRPSSFSSRPSSFSSNRGPSNGGYRSGGRPRMARKMTFFDPSLLIKRAVDAPSVPEAEKIFTPLHTFTDFALHEQLYQNIVKRGYLSPTPIQDQAIPHLLEGKDLVGLANTGTGKTAAFLIPLINKVVADREQRVLIVAPTRELATQIEQEFRLFAAQMNILSVLCIGGMNIERQVFQLRKRPHFVIGTPGRLTDLEKRRSLDFRFFNSIVLDEVDQMLNMGFIRDVRYITSLLPKERQSLFFSATLPDVVQRVMHDFLRNPVTVSVKSRDSAADVDQDIVKMNGRAKMDMLHDLLKQDEFQKVLVFSRTKHSTEQLARSLDQRGFAVGSIHGNKNQNQRQRAIELFKRDRIQVLVATDVASRGLDIENVSHVINFDLPETYEDYIHRIGRTGRAGKKGSALTFVE